jgi:hypothetical protein
MPYIPCMEIRALQGATKVTLWHSLFNLPSFHLVYRLPYHRVRSHLLNWKHYVLLLLALLERWALQLRAPAAWLHARHRHSHPDAHAIMAHAIVGHCHGTKALVVLHVQGGCHACPTSHYHHWLHRLLLHKHGLVWRRRRSRRRRRMDLPLLEHHGRMLLLLHTLQPHHASCGLLLALHALLLPALLPCTTQLSVLQLKRDSAPGLHPLGRALLHTRRHMLHAMYKHLGLVGCLATKHLLLQESWWLITPISCRPGLRGIEVAQVWHLQHQSDISMYCDAFVRLLIIARQAATPPTYLHKAWVHGRLSVVGLHYGSDLPALQ